MKQREGYSLLEVVLALGLLAVGVIGLVALLLPISQDVGASDDADVGAQLADRIRHELEDLRDAAPGAAPEDRLEWLAEEAAAERLRLVADRRGGVVRLEAAADGMPVADRYYVADVQLGTRFGETTARAGFIVLTLRIQWPYHLRQGPGDDEAAVVPVVARQSLRLNIALHP